MTKFLNTVEEVEPIGFNQWIVVAEKYKDYAVGNNRPYGDQDALKAKFDKIVNVKKPAKDLSIPANRNCAFRCDHVVCAIVESYKLRTF